MSHHRDVLLDRGEHRLGRTPPQGGELTTWFVAACHMAELYV